MEASGYKTAEITTLEKLKTYDFDGPARLSSFFSTVKNASALLVEVNLVATWNPELIEKVGMAIGNECLWSTSGGRTNGVNGWYVPGMNIHRSAFGGRNFEYFSEDSYLTGASGRQRLRAFSPKAYTATSSISLSTSRSPTVQALELHQAMLLADS